MKKLNLFLGLGALSLAMLFTSCNKDEDPPLAPVISFDAGETLTLEAGVDSAVLTGTIKAEGKLVEVEITRVVGDVETLIEAVTDFSSGAFISDDDINCTFRYGVGDITEDISIKFKVTDKEDQATFKTVDIAYTAVFDVSEYTNILLNAQANGPTSAAGNNSFLSTTVGEIYTLDEVNTDISMIDIMFMRHTVHKAVDDEYFSLRSPDNAGIADYFGAVGGLSYPSTGLKSTKLLLVTSTVDWDNLDAESFATATTGVDSGSDIVTELADGDIVAFQTQEGKNGLIKVNSIIDPGDIGGERYQESELNIDFVVEN